MGPYSLQKPTLDIVLVSSGSGVESFTSLSEVEPAYHILSIFDVNTGVIYLALVNRPQGILKLCLVPTKS